jgi:hypothetical protein
MGKSKAFSLSGRFNWTWTMPLWEVVVVTRGVVVVVVVEKHRVERIHRCLERRRAVDMLVVLVVVVDVQMLDCGGCT